MKHILICIYGIVISYTTTAQITLDNGDLPKVGDVQLRARVDSLEELMLDPGEAGENIDWEFGWLNYYGSSFIEAADSVMWIDNIGTSESDSFLLANIVQRSNCYFYHNWQTHAISLECYNKYYAIDEQGLHLIGSTYPKTHRFYSSRNIFPLLNYGDTLIESSREVINLSADSIFVTYIIDTTIVDGWGTVHTPIDDLDVLRYHTTETVWDSLYVNSIGEEINHMPDNYYFRWFAKKLGFPVFQISKGVLEDQSQYQVTRFKTELKRVDVENNIIPDNNIIVYPNPAKNDVTFFCKKQPNIKPWSVFIYDLNSKLLASHVNVANSETSLLIEQLSNGVYLYKIISENVFLQAGKLVILK